MAPSFKVSYEVGTKPKKVFKQIQVSLRNLPVVKK